MPMPSLDQIKPEYLAFIDLVSECRRQSLGKRGHILVPKNEMDVIAPSERIDTFVAQLGEEGILGIVKDTDPPTFSRVIQQTDGEFLELNCLRSIEEIADYRDSLQGITARANPPMFDNVRGWDGITIRFTTDREVVITTPDGAQRITDYSALGFSSLKSGRPVAAWVLLYGLSLAGGQYAGETPIPDNIKQQKKALSDHLRGIFGLDTDPFETYRDRGTYQIRIALSPPQEETPADDIDEFTGR